MIRFAEPRWLLLLTLLPVAIFFLIRRRKTVTPKMIFSSLRLIDKPTRSLKILSRPLPKLLTLIASVLLVVALARPQTPWSEQKRKTEGIGIMLVLDVSESMRALDFEPNRMEKSKEVVKDFIAGRTDDMIGITIFGKETFTLCPMTRDYAALETFVDRIGFDLLDGNATAIGMGLANGINKIKDSPTKSKVIILLTDGENNHGQIQPLTAGELAQKLKIRCYTIGVGSEGLVEIPMKSPLGGWTTGTMQSHIDEATLSKIAEMTGGKFFRADDGESLKQIYSQIDKMERTKIETSETNYFDERAAFFLIPALALFGLAFLLERTWLWSFP